MKLSERLEHWEDMSPMEFVAVRKAVAQLEEELAARKARYLLAYADMLDALLTAEEEDDETEREDTQKHG